MLLTGRLRDTRSLRMPPSSLSPTFSAARFYNVAIAGRRLGRTWAKGVAAAAARKFLVLWPVWVGGLLLGILFAAGLDEIAVSWENALALPILRFFNWVTDFGKSNWLLYSSGGVSLLLLFADWRCINRRVAAAWTEFGLLVGFTFLSIAGAGIVTTAMKHLVGRIRPTEFADEGAFSFVPLQFDYVHASFPSGHATTMGALAVVISVLVPRLRIPAFAICLLVASSRVFIGVHFPSDVVAGFLIGAGFTWLYVLALAEAGIVFAHGPGGTIRARTLAMRHVFLQPGGFSVAMGGLWLAVLGIDRWALLARARR